MLAGFVEAFFKEVVTDAAGLRKTIHTAGPSDVHPYTGWGLAVEFIFLYDFLCDVAELYLGNFGSFEGCHEVEVDRSMLMKRAPGVEITLLRNILMRRSVAVLVPMSSR
jgi:hypothetical protein